MLDDLSRAETDEAGALPGENAAGKGPGPVFRVAKVKADEFPAVGRAEP